MAVDTVAPSVKREQPGLLWLKPGAYWRVARTGDAKAKDPKATIQLYTANHAALRAGGMARDGVAMRGNVDTMPHLDWGERHSAAQAAVIIGWWSAFFKDYGWSLRRETTGKIRVYDLATGTAKVRGGSRKAGSIQAARVLNEGNAVVSGLVLRGMWQADLSPIASLGGTPFQGRNANPRVRLDLDTIGSGSAPRPINTKTVRKLTTREGRKHDLTWTAKPLHWKYKVVKPGSPLAQIVDTTRALGLAMQDSVHAKRVMIRIAYGAKTGRYTAGASTLTLPDADPAGASGHLAR